MLTTLLFGAVVLLLLGLTAVLFWLLRVQTRSYEDTRLHVQLARLQIELAARESAEPSVHAYDAWTRWRDRCTLLRIEIGGVEERLRQMGEVPRPPPVAVGVAKRPPAVCARCGAELHGEVQSTYRAVFDGHFGSDATGDD